MLTVDVVGTGCIIPGHLGQYAAQHMCEWAMDLGWNPPDEDRKVIASNGESVAEIAYDAEGWLNANLEDGVAYWSDGEFFVHRTEKCPRCGERRFSDEERIFGDATKCPEHEQWY